MLARRLYYTLKPRLPWVLRMALRRFRAKRLRQRHADIWPILPGSERVPAGWPGWPDGRRFAFVLTHDVEGLEGLARVRPLAELEMSLGFRSSFNFIPEGDYRVSEELRAWLASHGFEVGVHDFYHDGRLFASRDRFREHARKINHYLKDWNATGFRAGFMLHNLAWQHDLNVLYDASTFDTDPFEPQPDGVGTIFPFWVPAPSSEAPARGYVELPYTLSQDVSLFLLLQETSIAIWRTKLDWIAGHGGMALVNVHPDYLRFSGELSSARTFPVEFYAEFLEHVRKQHGASFWQPLPKEVAAFAAQPKPQLRPKRKRVCLVGPLFYEADNRTMRYAEALQERGDEVEVVALRQPGQDKQGRINGVKVFHIQGRVRNEVGVFSYAKRLSTFMVRSLLHISVRHLRKPYDLVHVHSIPDFEVFAAVVPKLTGAKVILDIYDVLPEFYLSKFRTRGKDVVYRLLLLQEKLSAQFADHVISANHLWQQKLTKRSVPEARCTPFVNYIDTGMFCRHARRRQDSRFIVIYPGVLNWHQGVDIIIRGFKIFSDSVLGAELHIYGEGNEMPSLLQLVAELGLGQSVFFNKSVPLAEIPQLMTDADLGVVGKRADIFGNEAYSTKILEYMSQGLPAVIPRTAIDTFYFRDSAVRFYEPGNHQDMAVKMLEVYHNPVLRASLVENGLTCVQVNSWESRKHDYLRLVDCLIANTPPPDWRESGLQPLDSSQHHAAAAAAQPSETVQS